MPLVTITVCKPKSLLFKETVLNAVHAALIEAGVPEKDKFQRILELDTENFRFDTHYPDLHKDRNQDFVLIEILWSVGRSVQIKKKLLDTLMKRLCDKSMNPENIMVCFRETAWENWSFAGGRLLHT
ncbi:MULTISPECIES: tautomerase family protein [unclassified Undibacterium]|uniref:tautomerase family protein n=1 Tax=Undibacterium TaxID=401469 RepID=UPI003BF06F6C